MARIFNTGKLVILGILTAGIIIFSVFFRDRIISSYAERGLEKIFNEPVHITGLKTSFLSSRLHIAAADIGNISIKHVDVDLDFAALLKKRLVIENMSGSITKNGSGTAEKAADHETSGTEEENGFSFSSVIPDAGNLVTDRLKDFAAFREIEKTKAMLKEETDKLKKDVEELRILSGSLKDKTENLSEIRIRGLNDGTEALAEINGLAKEINTGIRKASDLKGKIDREISSAKNAEKRIRSASEEDYRTIDSLISNPAGSAGDFASGYCRKILARKTGRFYPLAAKAVTILNNTVSLKKGSEKNGYKRTGRTVQFKAEKLPLFLLEKARFTFEKDMTVVEISNISSNPELLSQPKASFYIGYKPEPSSAEVHGEISFNGKRYSELAVTVEMENFPVSSNGFSGRYNGSGSFVLSDGKQLTGNMTIHLTGGHVNNPEENRIIDEINKALDNPSGYDITAVIHAEKGNTDIKVSTTLDNLVMDIINQETARTAENLRKLAKEEYKMQVDSKMEEIQPYLDNLDSLKSETDAVTKEISEYKDELSSAQSRIKDELKRLSIPELDKLKDSAGTLKLPF